MHQGESEGHPRRGAVSERVLHGVVDGETARVAGRAGDKARLFVPSEGSVGAYASLPPP